MDIESDKLGISPNPGSYRVTVRDTSVQPTVKFSKTNASALTEETQTTVQPCDHHCGRWQNG